MVGWWFYNTIFRGSPTSTTPKNTTVPSPVNLVPQTSSSNNENAKEIQVNLVDYPDEATTKGSPIRYSSPPPTPKDNVRRNSPNPLELAGRSASPPPLEPASTDDSNKALLIALGYISIFITLKKTCSFFKKNLSSHII